MRIRRLLGLFLVVLITAGLFAGVFAIAEEFEGEEDRALAKTKITDITWARRTGVTLKWKPVSGASRYEIFRSQKKSGAYKKIGSVSKTVFTDRSAKTKRGYYYSVRPVKGKKHGKQSTAAGIYTVPGPRITSVAALDSGSLEIQWKKNKKASGYVVYRAPAGTDDYVRVGTVRKSKTRFIDTKVRVGEKYTYAVAGKFKASGGKVLTGGRGAERITAQGPGRVTGVSGELLDRTAVLVSWRQAENAESYEVYLNGKLAGATKSTEYRVGVSQYSGLAEITVRALGTWNGLKDQPGDMSEPAAVAVFDAPTVSVALGARSGDGGKVNASWNKVSGAEGYRVEFVSNGETTVKTAGGTSLTQVMPRCYMASVRVAAGCKGPDGSWLWSVPSAEKGVYVFYGKVYALLIGICNYTSASVLKGPRNDVDSMAAMLNAATGIECVIRKVYDVADSSGFASEIKSAFTAATADDICLFYYSGHGSSNGSLCGIGGSYPTTMSPAVLKSNLAKYGSGCPKIVMLDSCYSGQAIDRSLISKGMEDAGGAGFNESVIRVFSGKGKAGELATGGYYVLTASSKNQTSFEYSTSSGVSFGLFTRWLLAGSGYNELTQTVLTALAADADNDRNITLQEAYVYTKERVSNTQSKQTVAVYPSDSGFVLWGR